MKIKLLLIGFVLISILKSQAQTFNGVGGVIHDYHGTAVPEYYHCVVYGMPSSIDATFGQERVCINISHTYDGDIQIALMSPDSFTVMLSNWRGGSSNNFTGTCFRGQGANGIISSGSASFTGDYDPDGNIRLFINGGNLNGT